jgi:hypothetical protein
MERSVMNGTDVKWLKEMFDQHNVDQQKYLDAKFESVEDKVGDVREAVVDLTTEIEDVEAVGMHSIDEVEDKVDKVEKGVIKKVAYGMGGAVVLSLLLWTALGTDALAIVLKFIGGVG